MKTLRIWNQAENRMAEEQIFGEGAIRALYENRWGQFAAHHLLSRKFVSQVYGWYQSTALSRKQIPEFIKNFSIPMNEFESTTYRSFNDFFIRKFRPGMRPFVSDSERLPAFAEGRYLGFDVISEKMNLPVKGASLNLPALLEVARYPDLKSFIGGPGYIARLCPVDYHRFHFPDDCSVSLEARFKGKLHSVSPIALAVSGDILFTNERHCTVLETANFGRLAYIEVGALAVGKIVQSYERNSKLRRGEEKGYFLFGGSTVILLGEPGAFRVDSEIANRTKEGLETLVQLGQPIGNKNKGVN